jgi:hypothetical protein
MVQSFWKRWSSEYLSNLQKRPKWQSDAPPLSTGDLVLLMEDNTPPLQWPLARVKKTYTGNDGFIRVLEIRTKKGNFNRPVVKLKKLHFEPDSFKAAGDKQ